MKYKATLRIPTSDQYAYIEPTVEGTPDEIVSAYYEFIKLIKPQEGLDTKDFNKALDRYLTDGTGETEIYVNMSVYQKDIFQEIKKSIKRLNKE